MSTAERRLEIMKTLCRQRHTTMGALAEIFSVSVRTIQRDILELTSIMPIDVKTGKYDGGVYVVGNYSFDRAYMTPSELELLIKVRKLVENNLSDREDALFLQIIRGYTKPEGGVATCKKTSGNTGMSA